MFCQRRPYTLGRQTKASRSKPNSGLRVVCFSRPLLFFLLNSYSRPGWLAFLSVPAHDAFPAVDKGLLGGMDNIVECAELRLRSVIGKLCEEERCLVSAKGYLRDGGIINF